MPLHFKPAVASWWSSIPLDCNSPIVRWPYCVWLSEGPPDQGKGTTGTKMNYTKCSHGHNYYPLFKHKSRRTAKLNTSLNSTNPRGTKSHKHSVLSEVGQSVSVHLDITDCRHQLYYTYFVFEHLKNIPSTSGQVINKMLKVYWTQKQSMSIHALQYVRNYWQWVFKPATYLLNCDAIQHTFK